jgi:hypothetical protein
MSLVFRLILFLSFISFSIFFAYTKSDSDLTDSDYFSLTTQNEKLYSSSLGQDKKSGNIVGIQTFMVPADYSSPQRFHDKIESYIIRAKQKGFIKEKTLVFFPEHIGTFLFLMNEKKQIYTLKKWSEIEKYLKTTAMINNSDLNFENPNELIKTKMIEKSDLILETYTNTFSSLAKKYEITLLSGSILLPNPQVKDNQLTISQGNFSHISLMYDKKGNIFSHYEKNNLFDSEKIFSSNGNLPPGSYSMPGFTNKVVVMYSRDSLENKYYTKQVYNTDLWLIMSYKLSNDIIPWENVGISGDPRYEAKPMFQDSEKLLSNKVLYSKYGVSGKFQFFPTKNYIEVFFKGNFYELEFEGNSSFGIKQNRQETVENDFHSAILNIYL